MSAVRVNADEFSEIVDNFTTPEKWFALGIVIAALGLDGDPDVPEAATLLRLIARKKSA